jgi:uncharacterized protein (DUF1015 family)
VLPSEKMAIVAPFKGLMYNFKTVGDPSNVVAPPYDVISEEEQDAFYQADPRNVIRLILGKRKTGDSDWDNRYTRSADCFKRWEAEDVFTRSESPRMYVTSHTFDPNDGSESKTRLGLIALVRIEDEDSGVILPHEKTFSAHKDDRLRLMRACNAQFSQILSLYEDPDHRVLDSVREVTRGRPMVSFDFKDGSHHALWTVQDHLLFKKVADALANRRIFIADGHHRYETARNYRNAMRARYGTRPPNRSYEFVMMYLTSMDDEGLMILSSHRLVKRCDTFSLGSFFEKISPWFDVEEVPITKTRGKTDVALLKRTLAESGLKRSTIGFIHQGGKSFFMLSLKPEKRGEMGDDLHPSLKQLDVLVLSRFLLQRTLGFTLEDLNNEEIFHYESSLTKAVGMVESGTHRMGFLLNPTRIEQVKEVAGNRLIMPRKSTYFYPKVITGLVFNKIDPHEIIQVL